jgi:hypothetical protein
MNHKDMFVIVIMDESAALIEGGGTSRVAKRSGKNKKQTMEESLALFFSEKGWRPSIVKKKLKHLIMMRPDLTLREMYIEYAQHWFHRLGLPGHEQPFKNRLYTVGFRKAMADELWERAEPIVGNQTSFTDKQVFDMLLGFTLGKYRPLKPNALFFSNEQVIGEWFADPLDSRSSGVNDSTGRRLMCNVINKNMEPIISKLNELQRASGGNGTLLYHTTSWTSLKSMGNSGIVPGVGRACLDFGITPSFYTTPQRWVSEEYGEKMNKMWSGEVCTLVFHVKKEEIQTKFKSRVFESVDRDWKRLCKSSRMCQDEINELDTCDFVYGPMVHNVNSVRQGDAACRAHKDVRFQLAAKKDKACEYLGANWIGTIVWKANR